MPHPARKHHEYSELPLAANDNYLSSALDKYLGYDDMLAGGGSGSEAWDLIYGGASGVIHFAAKTTEGVVKFPLGMDLAAEGIYSLYKDPSLYLSDINNCSGYLQCANAYTETTLNTASILYGGYQIGKAGISFTASALKSDTVNLNTYNQNIFHFYEPEALWNGDIIEHPIGINYTYNAITNPGPLANIAGTPASNFWSGKYNMKIADDDMVVYRGGDSTKSPLGQWYTSNEPKSIAQIRIDNAVKEQWIDPKIGVLTGTSIIDTFYTIKIPKGTIYYEGPIANQGGVYLGGYNKMQIFIPRTTKGLKAISSKPIN